ncbi:uracil phosphoribosyltransferase [Flavobacterium rhizosphaerae]|uniref:Uracil phosphoribosyltransferase n=1 Tax=Flavobacterium rhizosphaerae TaxID=3163298 RepID=A0ABW8YXZ1_9FLAO
MKLHQLSQKNSLLNHFLLQLRDVNVQGDAMRFRANMKRLGQVMAYEISKELSYTAVEVTTPLGKKQSHTLSGKIVVCSVLRAGLALHDGLLDFFDDAENGFISAYRHHPNNDEYFEIVADYKAVPDLNGKIVLLADPMLATGQSLIAVYEKLFKDAQPAQVHVAVAIAAPEGVAYLQEHLPDSHQVWIGDIDSHLNDKKYIVPGLGDAGDLAYGTKL